MVFEAIGTMPFKHVYVDGVMWEQNWHGSSRRMSHGEHEWYTVQYALIGGLWDEMGDVFDIEEASVGEERVGFSVREGLLRGSITLDAEGEPERASLSTPGTRYSVEFGEYGLEPLAHPRRVRVEATDASPTVLHVDRVSPVRGKTGHLFSPPEHNASRVEWSTTAPNALDTRLGRRGHHLVRGRINDRDMGWLVFDSGASASVINADVARSLGLEALGSIEATGVGGVVDSGIVLLDSVSLGPMTLRDHYFVSVDLGALEQSFGVRIAGIIGYDVLSHAVARVVARSPVIELYPTVPEGLELEWRECDLSNRIPVMAASVEGREGVYRIDTGAAGTTVDFHTHAVKSYGLLDDRETTRGRAGGIGRGVPMRQGSVERFEFAGHAWRDLDVGFSLANTGAFNDPYTDGNIGGRVLERFELWFDLRNERIGFARR